MTCEDPLVSRRRGTKRLGIAAGQGNQHIGARENKSLRVIHLRALRVFGCRRSREQRDLADEADEDQIKQAQCHEPMILPAARSRRR